MTAAVQSLFVCPRCRNILPARPPCGCGFVLRESDGIIDLLNEDDALTIQPFLQAYETVRVDEQWGGDDLDLPFHPKRHRSIWNIRQRTFRAFETAVRHIPRGLAVDAGAGNCWMTRYLDQWGFGAIGVDVNTSANDGLRAGQKFIDEGAVFLRVRAAMERLPFESGRIRLLAANASFHYARDFRAALAEFGRVLTPGGTIAIIDTPFYESSIGGERMMARRVAAFRDKYDVPEHLARHSSYMTYESFLELATSLGLGVRIRHVWPGLARKYEELRGVFAGGPAARFPLVLLEKR